MADDQRTESTQELTDAIERLNASIEKSERAKNRRQYTDLGFQSARLGVDIYRERRRFAGRTAAAGAAGGAARGFAGSAARGLIAGAGGRVLAGAILGGGVGLAIGGMVSAIKSIGGRGGGRSSLIGESKQQTELLANLYRQSLRQTRSTEMLTAIAAARADPLGGTARAARARLASQGTGPTRGEAYRAALLTSARGEVGEARSAISRLLRDLLTPLRTAAALNQSAMLRGVNDTLRFRGGITGQLGRLQTLQGITSGNPLTALRYGMNRISDLRNMQATDNTLNRGPLGGPVERALFQLQTYGPGQVGRPPASVRGGGMSEYAFRVRRQYEEFDRERIREWQDKVLLALESLVQQGKLSADELYQKQVEFSRVPRIDGVQ